MNYTIEPIATVLSPFTNKFGIPRQPGLATEAIAELKLLPPYNRAEAVVGLELSSHIWLEFIFHKSPNSNGDNFRPSIRPPRLGGNKRMGVFATRSPVRPNALGLSVAKLEKIDTRNGVSLLVSGLDLLDGTPIVDIKPYVPYADSLANASNQFAAKAPATLAVTFAPEAAAKAQAYSAPYGTDLTRLIIQILSQDPRPQYQQPDLERRYGINLYDLDIQFYYRPKSDGSRAIEVTHITTV
jgi:tRNA-Thr(GGU) m(6)t(6)A37 methyltransferase TsaA